MKKATKIILGITVTVLLLGLCFTSLSLYAKREINKPRFELPALSGQQGSPLPADKAQAFDYVSGLYQKVSAADDVEISLHTDVDTTRGEKVMPFSDADNKVISRALEKAQGRLGELYPKSENVLLSESEGLPPLGFTVADIIDFTAEKGRMEDGKTVEEEYYFISFTLNNGCIDTRSMLESGVRKSIEKELSSVLSVSNLDIEPESFTVNFKIRYFDDLLTHVEFKRCAKIKASVDFTGEAYKALDSGTVRLELPFDTAQSIDVFSYGIHFTERQIAVQTSDIRALPLEVRVNSETTKEDYGLSFDVSKDGLLEIDDDGVMSVKAAQKAPVTVTATLEYDGHKYTDTLIVYVTELEVKTDEYAES